MSNEFFELFHEEYNKDILLCAHVDIWTSPNTRQSFTFDGYGGSNPPPSAVASFETTCMPPVRRLYDQAKLTHTISRRSQSLPMVPVFEMLERDLRFARAENSIWFEHQDQFQWKLVALALATKGEAKLQEVRYWVDLLLPTTKDVAMYESLKPTLP